MFISIAFIVTIAIALQIVDSVLASINYYINLNQLVLSKPGKKRKRIARILGIIQFIISIVILGYAYAIIQKLYLYIPVTKEDISIIIKSPKSLIDNNKWVIAFPLIVLGSELFFAFKGMDIKKIKILNIVQILSTFLLAYWSYVLPVCISIYWIIRDLFRPFAPIIKRGVEYIPNKIVQKKMFKNPNKYREYLIEKQEYEKEENKINSYDLSKFINAQNNTYEQALNEIQNGKKEGHWIWYIFPQLRGLGLSNLSDKYGITDLYEAKAYMRNDTLKKRLIDISNALLSLETEDISSVVDETDALKIRSCMTLFNYVCPEVPVFELVLAKYFDDTYDERTLELLANA